LKDKIEIIKQSGTANPESKGSLNIFGKKFDLLPISDHLRIILHEDYPMVKSEDLRNFTAYSKEKTAAVVSGCKAKVHPYRLMYIDKKGFDRHLANIPQALRGNRHSYPDVYTFVPALIAIPPGIAARNLLLDENIDMYIMPDVKLLDRSCFTEKLLIMALKQPREHI
jgi:CMP-N-acetylneuraminic acid synthetase